MWASQGVSSPWARTVTRLPSDDSGKRVDYRQMRFSTTSADLASDSWIQCA